MTELNAKVVLDLTGNLQARADRYADSLNQMATKGSRSLNMLQRSVTSVERNMDRMANRWVALATGAGAVATGKMLVGLEERFVRLGIQANVSDEAVDGLKRRIFEVAQQPDIRIDPSELTGAVEEIIEKTGDLDFAKNNLETFAAAISATGAAGVSIGGIAAEFQKMGIINPKDVREALDILTVQGKEGAFTLQNLAALGPRVVTAYTSMGRGGVQGIREMGAALQVIRQGTGSSEMAATAFEALMRTLGDGAKIKDLMGAGIQVFDPEQAKLGKEVIRPINELMVDIIKSTKGRKTLLGEVFDAEAMRSFNSSIDEFLRTGSVDSLSKFMNLQADGTAIMADSKRAANTAAGAMRYLYASWQQFSDSNLTQPITQLGDALNSLEPGRLQEILETAKDVALALGAIYIGIKTIKGAMALQDIAGKVKRGGAGTGGAGGALGSAAGAMTPIPVFVVNGGDLGGDFGGGGSKGRKGKKGAKPRVRVRAGMGGKVATSAGRIASLGAGAMTAGAWAGGVLGAGAIGYGIGSLINEAIEGTDFHNAIGKGIAHSLAFFGNDNAQAAIAAEERASAELKVVVEDKRVRVERVTATGMNVEALGPTMGDNG